jgi:hypothetical protein
MGELREILDEINARTVEIIRNGFKSSMVVKNLGHSYFVVDHIEPKLNHYFSLSEAE